VNTETGREFSLRDFVRVLNRRRRILRVTAAIVMALAILACIFMTRRFQATNIFEMQKSSSDDLDLSSMIGGDMGGGSDSLSLNTDLQTQASILQSDTLALKVIKELNLEKNEDFLPHFDPIAWTLGLFTPAGPADRPNAPLEEAPKRRARLLKVFSKHLDVKVDAGTRLIEVSFENRDPKVAAAVTNHLVQALIDYTFQTKYTATLQVSSWLEDQLSDLRKQSEDLQAKVAKMQQQNGIFGVGGTDLQGKPVVYSPILDRLEQSSAMLTQSEMNRVIKESVYKIAQTGDAEAISQLAGTTLISQSGQGVTNSLTLVQNLRTQESTLKAQIGQDAAAYGPAYPKLIQERASLKAVQESLRDEVRRVADRARNDYEVANATENGAKTNYNKDVGEAEKLNDKTIEYMILSRESQETDDLYQDLLKRLKEAGILEGLKSSNLTVVDTALPPAKPSRPNVPVILLVGLFGAFFLGGTMALITDAIDNKVRGTDEIESGNLPLLGMVPQVNNLESTGKLLMLETRTSEFSEAVRRLRSSLLISRSGNPPQILLVSSGSPGEGKSTLSLNLASALAQYQKKVLLVEADMRRPVMKVRLGLHTNSGLSVLLANHSSDVAPEALENQPGLYVMPAGPTPPFPSELLGSPTLHALIKRWRQEFDFVVIDSPPVLPVTDVQILVAVADSTVLVARAGSTTRVGLQRAYSMLVQHVKDQSQPSIGVLLNGVATRSAAYYGYYGTYGYKNYYGQEDNKKNG